MASQSIGRYRILRELGRGATATVYLARDPGSGRQVAVKVLAPAFTGAPDFAARFEQTLTALTGLEHPYLLTPHDHGRDEEQYFLVMRYLAGGTLADRMDGRPMLLAEVVPLLQQLAEALDAAHTAHLVHGDLHPADVLFDLHERAVLADLGLAQLLDPVAGPSPTGTAAYMSPEQIAGQPIDGRADVYALGIMLFEMLTGRQPYAGDTVQALLGQHLEQPVPQLSDAALAHLVLPLEFNQVIARALAKNRDYRYPTAGVLAEAVRATFLMAPADAAESDAPPSAPPPRRAAPPPIAPPLITPPTSPPAPPRQAISPSLPPPALPIQTPGRPIAPPMATPLAPTETADPAPVPPSAPAELTVVTAPAAPEPVPATPSLAPAESHMVAAPATPEPAPAAPPLVSAESNVVAAPATPEPALAMPPLSPAMPATPESVPAMPSPASAESTVVSAPVVSAAATGPAPIVPARVLAEPPPISKNQHVPPGAARGLPVTPPPPPAALSGLSGPSAPVPDELVRDQAAPPRPRRGPAPGTLLLGVAGIGLVLIFLLFFRAPGLRGLFIAPTDTPTATPSSTATPPPSATVTPSATATATDTATATLTATPTLTASPTVTPSATVTPSPSETAAATRTPTRRPTRPPVTPTGAPSDTPAPPPAAGTSAPTQAHLGPPPSGT